MADLRIAFMGTPAVVVPIFAVVERIAADLDAEIVAVYTGPDRPAGRRGARWNRRAPEGVRLSSGALHALYI